MLNPRARATFQAVRAVGALVALCSVVVIWMQPNPYVWWAFLSFVLFGFPAAIATLIVIGDKKGR